ncbi:Carotenoid cleavage dioxygenase 7, chloroplastic [Ancistrocladus abbreviatus]
MAAAPSHPSVRVKDKIDLTEKETQIFNRLLEVLRHFNLYTQLRVAGGWVRDKRVWQLATTESSASLSLSSITSRQYDNGVRGGFHLHKNGKSAVTSLLEGNHVTSVQAPYIQCRSFHCLPRKMFAFPPQLLNPSQMRAIQHHVLLPPNLPPPLKFSPPLKPPSQSNRLRSVSISMSSNSPPTTRPDHDATTAFWDYQLLFTSQRLETLEAVKLNLVHGEIPVDFPSGTYYLIGPGQMIDDHGSTVHPLDGHGYLRAFEIDGRNREVKFSAKYVRTEAQLEEFDPVNGSWRFTHRGPFSVLKGGKKVGNVKVMKNVANTSVLWWDRRLFCLWEGGVPYEIKPGSLDTIGWFDLVNGEDCMNVDQGSGIADDVWDTAAGLLRPILYGVFKMFPRRILSHYKIDARRNRLLIMSCNAEDMLLPRSHFTFYEFDSNFKLLQKREFSIPDHLIIHDWAFTDTHYILFANRVKLDASGSVTAVCGLSPMISALSVNPSRSTTPIYLLPRFSKSDEYWRVPIEAPLRLWLLHVANAFEDIDEVTGTIHFEIHANACSYQWFNFHKLFGYNWQCDQLDPSIMNSKEVEWELLPRLVQVSIDLDLNGQCQKCGVEPLNRWMRPSDFPVINPNFSGNRHTSVYAAACSGSRQALPCFPFDTVVKLNTSNKSAQTWHAGRRRFVGEPMFVSKGPAGEDDGYLLVVEYAVSVQRCYLLILDANRIGEADVLVARIEKTGCLKYFATIINFEKQDAINTITFLDATIYFLQENILFLLLMFAYLHAMDCNRNFGIGTGRWTSDSDHINLQFDDPMQHVSVIEAEVTLTGSSMVAADFTEASVHFVASYDEYNVRLKLGFMRMASSTPIAASSVIEPLRVASIFSSHALTQVLWLKEC